MRPGCWQIPSVYLALWWARKKMKEAFILD